MSVNVEELLSEAYAARRRSLIGAEALQPEAGRPAGGGTVYLAAADEAGNMVSFIQSNYMGFGSGIVIPDTGISLQNRGHTFSLDPSHENRLEPGKKTYHTIIPGFLTKGGQAVGPFGVMGGFMQPQGHLQVIMNAIDFRLNPQAALDAPRWQWIEGKTVEIERHFPEHIALALARKGHTIRWGMGPGSFGRGQIIWRDDNGVLVGGTDWRADGTVAVW
jgi:gamma-glutamyltranspeptidase/glutathione hydrolase